MQDLIDRGDYGIPIRKELVDTGSRFQIFPKTLNWIELRTIPGQEQRQQAIFQHSKGSLAGQAVMDGTIVQVQNESTCSGMLLNQMPEKSMKVSLLRLFATW